MTRIFLPLLLLMACSTGCCFVDAGFRELQDDGPNPRYAHQPYMAHVVDSLTESDDDRRCDDTTVVVYHRHGRR
ncbi:MAG: hypothetical protein AB7N76_25315 [Planctomycetota bacterium]